MAVGLCVDNTLKKISESLGMYESRERKCERTDGADAAVDQPSGADKDADASDDLDGGAGWADRGAGAVGPKCHIIR